MTTSAVKRPLRIGVLLNSTETSAWRYKVLEDIANSGFCEIVLAVIDDRPPPRLSLRDRLVGRIREWWRRGLYNAYLRWDQNRYRQNGDAFATKDASALLPRSIRMRVTPLQGKFVDRFAPDDIERIKAADLDVLIRFGFRILKGEILKCARYGVWSYHHGDNREYRGGPPLFWEMVERNPVSGTVLQVLTEDLDGGHVLYRSWSATRFDSLYLNRNATYWKTAEFMLRCLRQLHAQGWESVKHRETQDNDYTKQIYRPPRNLRMAAFWLRQLAAGVRNRLRNTLFRTYDHWQVAIRPAGSWQTGRNGTQRMISLKPPDDRFYADPFIWKHDGRNYVFFEDYRFAQSKGLIACAEIRPDGSLATPETVLERDYHLSYPFIFERAGAIYMIPETKAAGRVELYRAVEFPFKWQFERVLLPNMPAVDATLHEAGGKLWMFCNIAAPGGSSHEELHLFHANDLDGPWQPHSANPVVSDVRRARPAGRLFVQDGELYRPAQDCSVRYGYAVQLNRVVTLNEDAYREEPCATILPDWLPGSLGTHTLNMNEDFEVLDAYFQLRKVRLPSVAPLPAAGQQVEKFRN